MDKRPVEKIFFQREHINVQQVREKASTSLIIRKRGSDHTEISPPTPCQSGPHQKGQQQQVWGRVWRKGTLCTVGGKSHW